MTWKDEIVEEVRRVRETHAQKFHYDIAAICADIRRQQDEGNRKVITSHAPQEAGEESSDIRQAA